jgi:DNA invertase Pin-like site-specific DNA recombinase
MKIGYVRVSKDEQNQDLQFDAMKAEGCDRVFNEKVSGAAKVRSEFERMQEQLRPGDTVVVYDIDRLGRTMVELVMVVDDWNERGIGFKSVSQPLIDTTTEHGEFIFKLFALLAELERKKLIRRTKAGLAAARARGRTGGRPKGLSKKYLKIQPMVCEAYVQGRSVREICQAFGIPSNKTFYKIVDLVRSEAKETA